VEDLLPNNIRFLPEQQMLIEQRVKKEKAKPLSRKIREGQIIEILRKKPKTISDVSIETGLSRYTLYTNYFPLLIERGIIEVKRKRKVSKIYANVFGVVED